MRDRSGARARLAAHRPILVLASAGVLLAVLGALRPAPSAGLPEDLFWIEKLERRGCADLVIAGDSRITIGVSPAAMAERLPGIRIRNFGFYGAGYSPEYIAEIPEVLDRGSPVPAILLGITPRSLTPAADPSSTHAAWRRILPRKRAVLRAFAGPAAPFAPMTLREVLALIDPSVPPGRRPRYHADGWESNAPPPGPLPPFDHFRTYYEGSPVSGDLVAGLLEAVRAWRSRGIQVFGFRPPAAPELAEIEERFGGFREEALVAAFRAAGGEWLRIEGGPYRTFDGDHLHEGSAILLSQELAAGISRSLAAGPPAAGGADPLGALAPSSQRTGDRRESQPVPAIDPGRR